MPSAWAWLSPPALSVPAASGVFCSASVWAFVSAAVVSGAFSLHPLSAIVETIATAISKPMSFFPHFFIFILLWLYNTYQPETGRILTWLGFIFRTCTLYIVSVIRAESLHGTVRLVPLYRHLDRRYRTYRT